MEDRVVSGILFAVTVAARALAFGGINRLDGWRKFVAWPEGITACALILTLGAIAWQAYETRRAANISSRTLISTFRPKVVVRSVKLNPPNSTVYQNIGDGMWKVELILANMGSTRAHVEKCEVKFVWLKDDPLPWVSRVTPIAAKQWEGFLMLAAARHALELVIPYQSGFSITLGTVETMLKMPSGHDQGTWPICHGTIVYADDNGSRRETGFFRKWNISTEQFEISEDAEFEYQD